MDLVGLKEYSREKTDCFLSFEPRCEKTGIRGFRPSPTQTGAVQTQKMSRCLKFRIKVAEALYYPLRKPIGDISLSGLGRDWTLRRYILHLHDI